MFFIKRMMYGNLRRFSESWFDMYGNWLEYSVKEDAAFCLCCYLFKNEHESSSPLDLISGFASLGCPGGGGDDEV